MKNLHTDPGCLYDTTAFLSRYFDEISAGGFYNKQNDNEYYEKIKNKVTINGIAVPHYLYPFFCRYKNRRPLLHSLLFEEQSYNGCTYDKAITIINHKQYLSRRLIENFFNSSDYMSVFTKIKEHPAGIEFIKKQDFDPSIEIFLYYIFIRYDDVIQILNETFRSLYSEIEKEREEFLLQNPDFIISLQSEIYTEKLKTLADVKKEELRFSFILMDADKIDFKDTDRGFFLLGYKYGDVLDKRYKYLNTGPYSFAQAIGNPVRYDIYKALLQKSPLTRADMENKLFLSRAALDHNLKIMRDTGLVVVEYQTGLSNYYKLDPEYIRITAELMLEGLQN